MHEIESSDISDNLAYYRMDCHFYRYLSKSLIKRTEKFLDDKYIAILRLFNLDLHLICLYAR